MQHYTMELSMVITDTATGKRKTWGSAGWDDLDDMGFGGILGLAASMEGEIQAKQKHSNKKKNNSKEDLTVTLTSKISSPDGGKIPDGANAARPYSGFDWHDVVDGQKSLMAMFGQLIRLGETHATLKHGPKKT